MRRFEDLQKIARKFDEEEKPFVQPCICVPIYLLYRMYKAKVAAEEDDSSSDKKLK